MDTSPGSTLLKFTPTPERTVGQLLGRTYFAGLDVAEGYLDFVVIDTDDNLVAEGRVVDTPAGFDQLTEVLDRCHTNGLPIPVAVESSVSLMVPALVNAGYPVVEINSLNMKNARKIVDLNNTKTDRIDCVTLAKMLIENKRRWAPIVMDDPRTVAMNIAARAEQDELRRGMKIAVKIRALLRRCWPDILDVFDTTRLREPKVMQVLAQVSTPSAARALSVDEWEALLRSIGGWRGYRTWAEKLFEANNRDAFRLHPDVERAFGTRLRILIQGMEGAVAAQQAALAEVETQWEEFPRRHLFETAPGFTPKIGARILSEIGQDVLRFPTAGSLAKYAGFAPVKHQSGKRDTTKVPTAYNKWLHQAVREWVMGGLSPHGSPGLAAHFRYRRQVIGDTGNQAYRNTAARLIHGIWHVLAHDEPWDDVKLWVHVERHLHAVEIMPSLKEVGGDKTSERKARFARAAHTVGIAS